MYPMKKVELYIEGTHCKACKILVEDALGEMPEIRSASVDLGKKTLTVETLSEKSERELASEWSRRIKPNGYSLSLDAPISANRLSGLVPGVSLGIAVLVVFFFLQKSGVVNVGFGETLTPFTAFFIGIVASVSSCLAIVGGLVLSLSATVSQYGSSWKPFFLFHVGRVAGFAVLGGLLGFLGSTITINQTVGALLGIAVSIIMILLGMNLLDIFHVTKKWQPTFGRGLFDRTTRVKGGALAPVLVGVGTFFLPCGFTQSMQFAALTSASAVQGSIILLFFALGTLPMLLALSWGSLTFSTSPHAPVFFKAAGTVVIGLGVFSLLSGFVGLGLIRPFFTV